MSMNSTLYQRWTISKEERADIKAAGKQVAARRKLFDDAMSFARLSGNYEREYSNLPIEVQREFSFRTFERMAKS